jgi:hypothetical protein
VSERVPNHIALAINKFLNKIGIKTNLYVNVENTATVIFAKGILYNEKIQNMKKRPE